MYGIKVHSKGGFYDDDYYFMKYDGNLKKLRLVRYKYKESADYICGCLNDKDKQRKYYVVRLD